MYLYQGAGIFFEPSVLGPSNMPMKAGQRRTAEEHKLVRNTRTAAESDEAIAALGCSAGAVAVRLKPDGCQQPTTNSQTKEMKVRRDDKRLPFGTLGAAFAQATHTASNAEAPWSVEEHSLMLELHAAGTSATVIAGRLGRGINATASRLKHIEEGTVPNHVYRHIISTASTGKETKSRSSTRVHSVASELPLITGEFVESELDGEDFVCVCRAEDPL